MLANIGWDENVAVSNLTKALLEDELGYERVEIDTDEDLDSTYRGVASGELDAFQDVWLPNQEALLERGRRGRGAPRPVVPGRDQARHGGPGLHGREEHRPA